MAKLVGELVRVDTPEVFTHPVGAQVVVTHNSEPVAIGKVDEDEHFEVEISDDLRGELTITMGIGGVAPTMVDFEGKDLAVRMIFSPGGTYY